MVPTEEGSPFLISGECRSNWFICKWSGYGPRERVTRYAGLAHITAGKIKPVLNET